MLFCPHVEFVQHWRLRLRPENPKRRNADRGGTWNDHRVTWSAPNFFRCFHPHRIHGTNGIFTYIYHKEQPFMARQMYRSAHGSVMGNAGCVFLTAIKIHAAVQSLSRYTRSSMAFHGSAAEPPNIPPPPVFCCMMLHPFFVLGGGGNFMLFFLNVKVIKPAVIFKIAIGKSSHLQMHLLLYVCFFSHLGFHSIRKESNSNKAKAETRTWSKFAFESQLLTGLGNSWGQERVHHLWVPWEQGVEILCATRQSDQKGKCVGGRWGVILLMEEIRLTSWYGKYPIIYRVSYIGAGFLPSTVLMDLTRSQSLTVGVPQIMPHDYSFWTSHWWRASNEVESRKNGCKLSPPKIRTWKNSPLKRRIIFQTSFWGSMLIFRVVINRNQHESGARGQGMFWNSLKITRLDFPVQDLKHTHTISFSQFRGHWDIITFDW